MWSYLSRSPSTNGQTTPAARDFGSAIGTPRRWYGTDEFDVARSLKTLIARLDAGLSRRGGVRTLSNDPRCLLRLASVPAPCAARLPDGTAVAAGDPIAELHLWNEHVPPVPASGPNLAWGRTVRERLDFSMRELAHAVRTDPSLRGVQACRARTNFDGPGCPPEAVSRLIERCGFGDVDEGAPSFSARVHDGFENVLIAALVWTYNPGTLSTRKFQRVRRPVWISRERLLSLYPER